MSDEQHGVPPKSFSKVISNSNLTESCIAELPNAELWQQEDLSNSPSLSTAKLSSTSRSNVNVGADVENVLSFESSPIPVFCVENRAMKAACDKCRKQISQGEQVSSNENSSKKKSDRVIQPSETEEMDLDQSLADNLMSENADDFDTNSVDIKPLYSNTLSSGGIIDEDSPLDYSTMKCFKIVRQEQTQNLDMSSGIMVTSVDMNATHCKRMSEIGCTDNDIKTEYSNEVVQGQSERVELEGHLDIKTEYTDECVLGHAERVVDHLDIKTEYSYELVSGQSETVVGRLDTGSDGDKSCNKMEDSIITDCEPDGAFNIEQHTNSNSASFQVETAFSQRLSTCDEPELDDEVYGDSHAKNLGISSVQHHGTRSRQTECRKDDDAQTMSTSVKDVHECSLCKLVFSSHQYLESHRKRRHAEKHWRMNKDSILKKSSAVGSNCCGDQNCTLRCNGRVCSVNLNDYHKETDIEQPFTYNKSKYNDCCNMLLDQYSCLHGQTRRHTGEEPFKCNECGKMFSQSATTDYSLHSHIKAYTREKLLNCSECGKIFSHSSQLHSHMRIHTEEKIFSCNECDKTFSESSNLHRHMKIHTGEKPFKCNECGKTFNRGSHLRRHMRTHTGEKPFQGECNECGKSFSRRSLFHRHMRTHTGETPFKCNECGKTFSQSWSVQNHMRTHTGERPFQCNECGKTFNHNGSFHRHMRTHTGEKPFKCDVCAKTFSEISNLHGHMKTHTGEKPFKCIECDKSFSRGSHLHRHMRTHRGEKLFKCDECGKTFSESSNLQSHMETHRGEKLFKCDECGKTFSESSNLQSHRKTHRGEKLFKCDECGKTFSENSNLNSHRKTHRGEKLFKCDECGKTFSQSWGLHSHMKTHA